MLSRTVFTHETLLPPDMSLQIPPGSLLSAKVMMSVNCFLAVCVCALITCATKLCLSVMIPQDKLEKDTYTSREETNLDGCEMLKPSVWMLDDVLRLRPIRGRVDADLIVLICGEQLGAVQWVEVGCEEPTVTALQNNL